MSDEENRKEIVRVHERLDDLFELIGDVRGEVSKVAAVCPGARKTVEKHERSLYGDNGTPGIVAAVDGLKREQRQREKRLAGIVGAVQAFVAAAVVGLAKLLGL